MNEDSNNPNNFNSINSNTIVLFNYNMEYSFYKKKLIREIFSQLDIIYEIFDKQFNENIIKIYILILKNKIPETILNEVLVFFELLSDLKDLEFLDQFEFLNIILDLAKINISIIIINDFFLSNNETGILNLINWKLIKKKFNNMIKIISSNNISLFIFLKIDTYNINLIKIHHEEIKLNSRKLADILSFDFFMYLSSSKMLKLLYKKLFVNKKNINNKSNNLAILLIKYQKYFIEQYKLKYELFGEIYFDIKISNISKYKYIKKNKYFDELFLDINSIDSNYKI